MQLDRSLLRWYFRAAWNVTWPAALVTTGFALFYPELLSRVPVLAWTFIFFHSLLLGQALGRFDTPAAAFLYTRGFSRDRLWAHRVAAQLLCIAAVWLPACLLVWLGLRSAFQDHVIQNAYYPLFRADDYWPPVMWLVGNVLLVGIVQYGLIRRSQPTREPNAGYAIAAGLFFAAMAVFETRVQWFTYPVSAAGIFTSVVLLWGSWRLHRTIEVYP